MITDFDQHQVMCVDGARVFDVYTCAKVHHTSVARRNVDHSALLLQRNRSMVAAASRYSGALIATTNNRGSVSRVTISGTNGMVPKASAHSQYCKESLYQQLSALSLLTVQAFWGAAGSCLDFPYTQQRTSLFEILKEISKERHPLKCCMMAAYRLSF